jgi:glycolate oxidase FAD binding subunit
MIEAWQAQIKEAAARGTPQSCKDHFAQMLRGDVLDTRAHAGIVNYEPNELVITVRAGTPLADVEKSMHDAGQMLAFEAPYFGGTPTIGGMVAAGLSGPRRPYVGAVRDFVLGVNIIDGKGDAVRFGGQVMKNVAGFDVSRLQTGAWGTLGLITEVSFKCLPVPKAETTLRFEMDAQAAIKNMNSWGGQALPLSAACWLDGLLWLRLSGAVAAVEAAKAKLGGSATESHAMWTALRDHALPFFTKQGDPLWRLSVKSTAALTEGEQLIDWGGAQRYLRAPLERAGALRAWAAEQGGHATLLQGASATVPCFHPLPPTVAAIHKRLKANFDPYNIFNIGRMSTEF